MRGEYSVCDSNSAAAPRDYDRLVFFTRPQRQFERESFSNSTAAVSRRFERSSRIRSNCDQTSQDVMIATSRLRRVQRLATMTVERRCTCDESINRRGSIVFNDNSFGSRNEVKRRGAEEEVEKRKRAAHSVMTPVARRRMERRTHHTTQWDMRYN